MGVTLGAIASASSVESSDTIIITQGGPTTRKATIAEIVAAGGGGGGGGGGGSTASFPYPPVQEDTYQFAGGTSWTYAIPNATTAGNLLQFVVGSDAQGSVGTPAGWTPTINQLGGSIYARLCVYTRIADGSETSITFMFMGGAAPCVWFTEFPSCTVDQTASVGQATDSPRITPPSITPTAGAAIMCCFTGVQNGVVELGTAPNPPVLGNAGLWVPFLITNYASITGRFLQGYIYRGAATGASIRPPTIINPLTSLYSGSGGAAATWSII